MHNPHNPPSSRRFPLLIRFPFNNFIDFLFKVSLFILLSTHFKLRANHMRIRISFPSALYNKWSHCCNCVFTYLIVVLALFQALFKCNFFSNPQERLNRCNFLKYLHSIVANYAWGIGDCSTMGYCSNEQNEQERHHLIIYLFMIPSLYGSKNHDCQQINLSMFELLLNIESIKLLFIVATGIYSLKTLLLSREHKPIRHERISSQKYANAVPQPLYQIGKKKQDDKLKVEINRQMEELEMLSLRLKMLQKSGIIEEQEEMEEELSPMKQINKQINKQNKQINKQINVQHSIIEIQTSMKDENERDHYIPINWAEFNRRKQHYIDEEYNEDSEDSMNREIVVYRNEPRLLTNQQIFQKTGRMDEITEMMNENEIQRRMKKQEQRRQKARQWRIKQKQRKLMEEKQRQEKEEKQIEKKKREYEKFKGRFGESSQFDLFDFLARFSLCGDLKLKKMKKLERETVLQFDNGNIKVTMRSK